MATKLTMASTLDRLADSVAKFLESPIPSSKLLASTIIRPLQEIGEVSILGGLVRDIAFYGPDERPISDIDLVVTGPPRQVSDFAHTVGARPNKFGGFGLTTEGFKADFWALSNTWARRQGLVRIGRASDLIRATFFDWDAVVYSTKSRRVNAIDGYLERIRSRVLDVNLLENPSVKGNLVRALRRIMMWDVRPGPRLRLFIESTIFEYDWLELILAEEGAFHTIYLENFSSAGDFVEKVLRNPSFSWVGRDDLRQTRLDLFKESQTRFETKNLVDGIQFRTATPKRRRRRADKEVKDFFK